MIKSIFGRIIKLYQGKWNQIYIDDRPLWLRYDGCNGRLAWLSFQVNTKHNYEGTIVIESKGANVVFRGYAFFVQDFDDETITIAPVKEALGSEDAED